jgi:hypothetical protein
MRKKAARKRLIYKAFGRTIRTRTGDPHHVKVDAKTQ